MTIRRLNSTRLFLLGMIAILFALFFIIDLLLPLGVAAGVLYFVVVLIGVWLPEWQYTIRLAVVASIFTGLGFLCSEPKSALWIVLTNRGLAFFVIWTTAILVLLIKWSEEKLVNLNKKLEQLSLQDELTETANRRTLNLILDREWQRCKRDKLPLSLIMLDVDFFKQYNDYYGHQQGDECLRQIAQTLKTISKRPADLVARYGGEEFVLLLPNTNNEMAIQLAKTCCSMVVERNLPHERSTVSDVVTISAGVATALPTAEAEPSTLLNSADKLLYQAKKNGRNQVAHQE